MRFFIDSSINLPQRLEHYFKSISEDEYRLESIEKVEYLSEDEIKEIIQREFGSSDVTD